MKILIPLLSLSPHGGTRVLTEIANTLVDMGHEVKVIAGNLYNKPTYPFDERVRVEILPQGNGRILSYLHLVRQISKWSDRGWMPVLNHALTFSNFLLPGRTINRSIIILQDMDWRGVKQPFGLFMKLGGEATLRTHTAIIAANPYLFKEVHILGNNVMGQLKLGISKIFCDADRPLTELHRDIDFFFIGRPQGRKRLTFYIDWLKHLIMLRPNLKIAAASQDKEVLTILKNTSGVQVFEPANDLELKRLYERSKFFLLASSAEGFALPPIEAMGSGCIPIITECGGPSVYARHNKNAFVLSKESTPQDVAVFCLELFGRNEKELDSIRILGFNTACDLVIDNVYNANLIVTSLERQCQS